MPPASFADPPLTCDIVMKGGITSGVVYPGAVVPLARRYRFKSIGGASAGGIAAAVVAAAEHSPGRRGFEEVAKLPETLASRPGDKPFMLQLFQPDPPARPLFRAILGFLQGGRVGGAVGVLRGFWHFPLLAALIAAAALVATLAGGADAAVAVAGVAVALAVLVAGVPWEVVRSVRALADNDFGMCRLGPGVGSESAPALTGWLHERLQTVSGKAGGPLTFADLWGVPEDGERRRERLLELSRSGEKRAVDLQMMTTDLTHGRPLRLPVAYQQHKDILEEGGELLFDPGELSRFFPAEVVEHMVAVAEPLSEKTARHLAREAPGRHFAHFPIGPELPVLVATRMSLSFPLLISAIPLWQLDFRDRPDEPPLHRVVFSDGGIASNFPVHFFDSPLPRRPTFGLHLTSFEPHERADPGAPCAAVRDPAAVNREAPEPTAEIDTLGGFFVAIKDAMQNWRDNAQSRLPGFRERIVHIKLDHGEGGLNLAMSSDKIRELTARGECAGERLVELFTSEGDDETGPAPHWNDHRYARYRTTMSLLERLLRSFARGYDAPCEAGTTSYADRVVRGAERTPYKFPRRDSLALAQKTTQAYLDLIAELEEKGITLDDPNVPRPPSALRAVPPV